MNPLISNCTMSSKPGYLRHIMGFGMFSKFASLEERRTETTYSPIDSFNNICKQWAAHTIAESESIPDREQNAIKIAADITMTGSPVICMEMGHINSATDFSHSHVQMLIPLNMVPTYQEELETHRELQVVFIDVNKEIEMLTLERFMNEQQKIAYSKNERKITLISKTASENYYNFTGIQYPLNEVGKLPTEVRDFVAREYVCMNITFIESSPETRIDFILSPVMKIAIVKQ